MCDFRAAFLRRRNSGKTELRYVPPRSLALGRAHASSSPINIEGRGQAGLRAWEIGGAEPKLSNGMQAEASLVAEEAWRGDS